MAFRFSSVDGGIRPGARSRVLRSLPLLLASCLLIAVRTPVQAQGSPDAAGVQRTLPPVPAPLGFPGPEKPMGHRTVRSRFSREALSCHCILPDSPYLNRDRIREAEVYSMSKAVPGRIQSIVNIHNPSIEVHPVEGSLNTGATVILAAGGGTIRSMSDLRAPTWFPGFTITASIPSSSAIVCGGMVA